jgi:hypothetical protein
MAGAFHFCGRGITAVLVRLADCLPEGSQRLFSSFSSSLQPSEQLARRQGPDRFVERERPTLTVRLPVRLWLQLRPRAKITFGEK